MAQIAQEMYAHQYVKIAAMVDAQDAQVVLAIALVVAVVDVPLDVRMCVQRVVKVIVRVVLVVAEENVTKLVSATHRHVLNAQELVLMNVVGVIIAALKVVVITVLVLVLATPNIIKLYLLFRKIFDII